MVSLIAAPEPSSCAAIVCIPSDVNKMMHEKLKDLHEQWTQILTEPTGPECKTQNGLIHRVFQTEVRDDLQVIGGM